MKEITLSTEVAGGGTGRRFMTFATGLFVAAAMAVTLVLVIPPSSAEAGICLTGAAKIVKRQNISCKQAKRVVGAFSRAGKGNLECRGDVARYRGWVARGIPRNGSHISAKARFVKGNRSFILSGGGAC